MDNAVIKSNEFVISPCCFTEIRKLSGRNRHTVAKHGLSQKHIFFFDKLFLNFSISKKEKQTAKSA